MIQTAQRQYEQVSPKVRRRIIECGEQLMLVEYIFQAGGVGEVHQHAEHEQAGYIAQGSFELNVGGVKRIARAGDSYHAPKNLPHGVVALEDNSIIIDAFTPIREDFLPKKPQ